MDAHRRMYATLIDAYGVGVLTHVFIDETKGEKYLERIVKKNPVLKGRESFIVDVVDANEPIHQTLAKHGITMAESKRLIRTFIEANARFFAQRLTPIMAVLYFVFFTTVMALINLWMNDDPIGQVLTAAAVAGFVFSFIMTVLFRRNSTSPRTIDKMDHAFTIAYFNTTS